MVGDGVGGRVGAAVGFGVDLGVDLGVFVGVGVGDMVGVGESLTEGTTGRRHRPLELGGWSSWKGHATSVAVCCADNHRRSSSARPGRSAARDGKCA